MNLTPADAGAYGRMWGLSTYLADSRIVVDLGKLSGGKPGLCAWSMPEVIGRNVALILEKDRNTRAAVFVSAPGFWTVLGAWSGGVPHSVGSGLYEAYSVAFSASGVLRLPDPGDAAEWVQYSLPDRRLPPDWFVSMAVDMAARISSTVGRS